LSTARPARSCTVMVLLQKAGQKKSRAQESPA
jgi:hypothetical protein